MIGSDRDSSSVFQYGAIAASGAITIARAPLMIGRCLGDRADDRIAEQEMATSGSALGCLLDRAGLLVHVVRAASWGCAAEQRLVVEQ